MGQVAAAAAVGGSLAELGFGMKANKAQARGEEAAYNFEAERAQKAADFGRLQAQQTDVGYREELNSTLANINVLRNAAGVDPSSPTTAAILANERRVSDRQRNNAVYSLEAQAAEDERAAVYRRSLARKSLKAGRDRQTAMLVKAGFDLAKGIPSGGRGGGMGSGGMGIGSTHTGLY